MLKDILSKKTQEISELRRTIEEKDMIITELKEKLKYYTDQEKSKFL